MAFIVVNWLVWGAICVALGGTALLGEIENGEYLIRRHPNSALVPVGPEFWIFSLVYSFLTFAASIPALALLHMFHRPHWDRGTLDAVGVAFGLLWFLALLWQAIPRGLAWAAV